MSDRHIRRTGSDYREAFLELLPQGQAWPKHSQESVLWQACDGLNQYWGYVDGRAADLLERESDPRITVELLPDWERNWGLPDPCYTAPQTIEARQTALIARMTLYGSQSRAFYINFASFLGYGISISEYRTFVCGVDRCGDSRVHGNGAVPYYDPNFVLGYLPVRNTIGNPVARGELSEWPNYGLGPVENRYFWTVHVDKVTLRWFRCASGQCGVDPHLRIGTAKDLECIINRWKPAHTTVIFDYSGTGFSTGNASGFGMATARVLSATSAGHASGVGAANAQLDTVGNAQGFGDANAVIGWLVVGSAVGSGTATAGVGNPWISTGSATGTGGLSAVGAAAAAGPFNDQTGNFTIQYDALPAVSGANEDVVTGLSNGVATGVTQMACIVRFFTAGNIDVRNGGAYGADVTLPYAANTSYHIRIVVRISNHTYDVFVTPQGQSEIALATNYAFRTEQAAVAHLNYLGTIVTQGGATLSNMVGPPPILQNPPVVTNNSFSLATSGGAWATNDLVGTMSATNAPTQWTITAGDPSGFYAIDNTGNLTVTAAGITGLGNHNGTSLLTCQATNSGGNGTGTATVNYAPASTAGFPTSASTGVPAGTVLTNSGSIGISTAGQTVSGLNITGQVTITASNVTLQNCRLTPGSLGQGQGILVSAAVTNVLIKNCTLVGSGSGATQAQYGILLTANAAVTVDGCNFSYWAHSCMEYGGCGSPYIIQNCYGDHMQNWSNTHYEHVYYGGGNVGGNPFSMTIRNCTWINENNYTAALFFKTDNGPINDVTIDNNHLVGGGWCIYVQDTGPGITNVRVTNNAFGKGLQGNGYCYPGATVAVWSGNYDDVTHASIPIF